MCVIFKRSRIYNTEIPEYDVLILGKRAFLLGEAEIIGDKIIFNVTLSPGATACLQNAEKTARKGIDFLAGEFSFDRDF